MDNVNLLGVAVDKIAAGLGLLMLTRHFGPGFGACAGAIAGMTLSGGMGGAFTAYTGIYAVSGMAAEMLQRSRLAAGAGYFITHFLFCI